MASLMILAAALCIQTEESFETKDKFTIYADYYAPPEETKRPPAVILLHMVHHDRSSWGKFPKKLAAAGFAVLAIDMRGHGKSAKERGESRNFSTEQWMGVLEDLAAARKHLGKKEGVNAGKLIVIGASIGANLALNYAVKEKKVKGIALLSPGETYRGVQSLPLVPKVGKRALFVAASRDNIKSARTAEAIHEAAKGKKKQIKIYTAAGHGTRMFGKEDEPGDLTRQLIAWARGIKGR